MQKNGYFRYIFSDITLLFEFKDKPKAKALRLPHPTLSTILGNPFRSSVFWMYYYAHRVQELMQRQIKV